MEGRRILIDGRVLGHNRITGIERYSLNVCRGLLSSSLNVELVTPSVQERILQHLWEHGKLVYLSSKFDLLFSPANIAPFYLPEGVKLVLTLHDVAFKVYRGSVSSLFLRYYNLVVPRGLRKASVVITVSEFSKSEIERFYPEAKGKIKVIYPGVEDLFRFEKLKREKAILYVGSLQKRKNFRRVIEAFLNLGLKSYELWMVGSFDSIFRLDKTDRGVLRRAEECRKIRFFSTISNSELVKLYNRAEFLLFPSLYEGFGFPPLEAMACGCPVIASSVSSLPEICGCAAYYCTPYTTEAIKEAMVKLICDRDLREELSAAGLKRVLQFNWERSVNQHIKLFQELLEK